MTMNGTNGTCLFFKSDVAQVVLVMPDTSPRGDGIPDEESEAMGINGLKVTPSHQKSFRSHILMTSALVLVFI